MKTKGKGGRGIQHQPSNELEKVEVEAEEGKCRNKEMTSRMRRRWRKKTATMT